jgi:hypothetical protein
MSNSFVQGFFEEPIVGSEQRIVNYPTASNPKMTCV